MKPPELHEVRAGSQIHPDLALAVEHAIAAGACRRSAALNPADRAMWRAIADSQSRKAIERLNAYLAARCGT